MVPSPLRVFADEDSDNVKEKITHAIRQIEIQRKELDELSFRLDKRRKEIFDGAVRAIEKCDEMRAKLLANEHVELQRVTRVVDAAELALLHIVVRLETMRDVGNVMRVLSNAFREVKKIGKVVSKTAPTLEQTANEINQSFSEILAELGAITPNITMTLADTPQEIFRKAHQLIDERTSELSELPSSIEEVNSPEEPSVFEKSKRIAMLATTDDDGEDDVESFKPVLLAGNDSSQRSVESAVREYIRNNAGETLDVTTASNSLNLPADTVERTYLKILSEDAFRSSLLPAGCNGKNDGNTSSSAASAATEWKE